MKFCDESTTLEVLEFDTDEELDDFQSLWQGRLSQTKCKIFGVLQQAARTSWLEVGCTKHSGNRKLWGQVS